MWRIFGGRKREAELDEELEAHIEIEATRLAADGLSGAEAGAQARRTFGNRTLVAELTRDSWGARWLSGIHQDLAYALRSVRRTPGFSAAVVLSLALGIGAATVVFSVADTVYLRPLPYRAPDELIMRIVDGWPSRFDARRALALGFRVEASFDDIIRAHIEDELGGKIAA